MILKIRQERIARGWTQAYVANQIGISLSGMNRIEKGNIKPCYKHLIRLEDLFGMGHRELFSISEDDGSCNE